MRTTLDSRGVALLAVAIAWAVFLTVIGSPEAMLFTVPLFMFAAPLALGRYLGEEAIARLATGRARRRPAAAVPHRALRAVPAFRPLSQLIASNLAGRAPPATA